MDDIVGHHSRPSSTIRLDDDVRVDEQPLTFRAGHDSEEEDDDVFANISLLSNPKVVRSASRQSDDNKGSAEPPVPPGANYFSVNAQPEDDEEEFVPPTAPTYKFPVIQDDISVSSAGSKRASPVPAAPPPPKQSYEELQQEKLKLLFKIERFKKQGYKPSKQFTMSSNIDDIRLEFKRLKHEKDLDSSIKKQQSILMMFTNGAEHLNNTFDPVGLKLKGWSESVHDDIDSFDDIFEELHDKYSEKIKMAPELQLLWALGSSAFMFHMAQSFFKQGIDLQSLMKQNPDLARQLAEAQMAQMGAQHGSNPMFQTMQQNVSNNMARRANQPPPPPPRQTRPPSRQQPQSQGIDDIINNMNNIGRPPSPSAVSERSGVSSKNNRRRRKKTDATLDFNL